MIILHKTLSNSVKLAKLKISVLLSYLAAEHTFLTSSWEFALLSSYPNNVCAAGGGTCSPSLFQLVSLTAKQLGEMLIPPNGGVCDAFSGTNFPPSMAIGCSGGHLGRVEAKKLSGKSRLPFLTLKHVHSLTGIFLPKSMHEFHALAPFDH